jgi:c-di-GMP-binding flagellar brake protein YcgR
LSDERREKSRMYVTWPITVITDQGTIEGESVNITASGVFVRCKQALKENETYQIIIRLPNKKQVLLKGKLVWSNLNGEERSDAFADMGFSFVKVEEQDQRLLRAMISLYGEGGKRAKER